MSAEGRVWLLQFLEETLEAHLITEDALTKALPALGRDELGALSEAAAAI
jgi:hypothetical protein